MATTISRANQPPPLEGYDLYAQNRPLVEAAAREGAGWANDDLRALGTLRGGVRHVRAGRGGRRLPARDDLRCRPGAARRAGARGGMGAASRVGALRPGPAARGGQGRRALRDGDDRAAGRLRRARERDGGAAALRRRGDAARREVVLLRADVRRVPDARTGAAGTHVLPRAARAC